MLKKIIKRYSCQAREKRAEMFIKAFQPSESDKILDLGSEDGSYIASIIPYRKNVYIADINQKTLNKKQEKYGFIPVLIGENAKLPFPDKYFDIVFSSSVIEHVSVDKADVFFYKSNTDFFKVSFKRQIQFASEIRRVGKRYFVQTPYKFFPIESHTHFPFLVVFLPRLIQIKMIKLLNRWWIKKTTPDWNLLTERGMKILFPEAEIVREKFCGLTKSIIAIKK